MAIDLPRVTFKAKGYSVCSVCAHSAAHCYCDSSGLSRADLDGIAVGILFGYDLSRVDQKVVTDMQDVLREVCPR